ncbi:Protein kinase [uncultured virus]|nr:Protein kinase [uncultured virus]
MSIILGQGTYGEVSVRDGKAVKKFSKLSHLIQEYMALKYLGDCKYVVHANGVDFGNLELHMDLYDCSLRKWLEDQRNREGAKFQDIMKIVRDILVGLVELHDRHLAHGDLKPGNILIRRNPVGAVLGDCGFVSIDKYAKVDRTASIYRDPIISHDPYHDMFSFGICFLEMMGEIKINRQASYDELKQVVREKVADPEYRKIIYNLLHSDRDRRPTARAVLFRLFKENPSKWIRPPTIMPSLLVISTEKSADYLNKHNIAVGTSVTNKNDMNPISQEERKYMRSLMKNTAYEFEINRGKKGYGALLSFIENHRIESSLHRIYTAVALMILSSIFGKSGFREAEVTELCENRYSMSFIYQVLNEMLSDRIFVGILLAP